MVLKLLANALVVCEIIGSHGGEYEDVKLLWEISPRSLVEADVSELRPGSIIRDDGAVRSTVLSI
jgi:hypothetical protein